jgi:hypothetical protein
MLLSLLHAAAASAFRMRDIEQEVSLNSIYSRTEGFSHSQFELPILSLSSLLMSRKVELFW